MSNPLEFGRKRYRKWRFQFFLVFSGLTICVTSTVLLISLGQSLGFTIFSNSDGQFTAAISNIVSKYVSFASILIFLSGMVTAYFLLSSIMADRIRDVGLIKTIGDVDRFGYSYLMSEPLAIIVSACSMGGIIGFLASVALSVFYFQLSFSSIIVSHILISLGVVLLSILLSWVVVARRTDNAFKSASIDLLAGDRAYFDFEKERISLVKIVAERFSPSVEIVMKSMFRSKSRSRTTIVCLIVSILLMTVSLVGGFLCWETSTSYAEMAIGQNILAIGDGILVDKYVSLLDPNSNASDLELQSFNFTSSRFILNETFIEGLGQLQGIEVVDTRLVTFTPVFEIQNTTAELDWVTRQTHYVITGDHRLKNCLVVGVDPAHLASSGFTQRTGVLNVENDDEAIVGDSLSEAIFQDPFKQSIRVSSNQSTDKKNFKIVNIVIDPVNHGMVLYVPFSQLWELFSVDGFNLVLVKVNGASGDAVSEITSLAGQYGLVVRNLDFVRNEYAASIDEIWFSVLPFAVLSVVTAMIGLLNSLFVSVSGRTHDFGILKAIGAKPNYLIKMVFLESSIFVLVTAPIGIIIGTLCVFLFLVPGATISVLFLATSLLAIAVMLLGMCLLSTLLVVHVRKKLPHELL